MCIRDSSTTLATVTSAAVAAFDADIARAVEDRAASVQRAGDTDDSAMDSHREEVYDDDGGELTLGQLIVDQGSQRSLIGAHEKVRQTLPE